MTIRDQFLKYSKIPPMTNSQSKLLDAFLEPIIFEKISHVGDMKSVMDSVYEFARSGEYQPEEKGDKDE